jgi:ornithine cyclodeaminase/alanine dehydrogenase-like protein (mu-crystallin family)
VQDTVADYEILEKRLAEAERRLVDARAHVRRQKELIESLERDGLSVAAEFTTLKNLQMLVRLRLENRDQLMRELHKPS